MNDYGSKAQPSPYAAPPGYSHEALVRDGEALAGYNSQNHYAKIGPNHRAPAGAGSINSQESMAQMIRELAQALRELSSEVIATHDQMHGARPEQALGAQVTSGWVEDLRVTAKHAHQRAARATKELHAIRNTIGL